MPLDRTTIAEGLRLEAAATPGPWCVPPDGHRFKNQGDWEAAITSEVHQASRMDDINGCVIGERGCYSDSYGGLISDNREADGQLIAFLRTHARALLTAASEAERSLDEAMQEFIDEYGTQFLRLEGPAIDGNWYAEVVASGIDDAKGVAGTPAEAIRMAVAKAKRQEATDATD